MEVFLGAELVSGLACLELELLAAGGDLHLTQLFWDVTPSSRSHNQDPGTEDKTSSGFPCQVQLTHLLLTVEAHNRILDLSYAACS